MSVKSEEATLATTCATDQFAAIAKYEEEMKARGGEEVRISAMNTRMLHDWNLILQSPVFRAGMAQKAVVPRD